MVRLLLLVVLGFLWSARLAAVKSAALSGVPVHVTVTFAIFGVGLFFLAVAIWRSTWPPVHRVALQFYVITGASGFLLPFTLENFVAPQLSLFVFVVIISTMPILTFAMALLARTERPRPLQFVAVGLGFCVALLVAWDTMRFGPGGGTNGIWVAIAFGVPALYAFNTVFVASRWPTQIDVMQVALAQAAIVSVAAFIGGLVAGSAVEWPMAGRNVPAIIAIALAEGVALMIFLKVARDYGAIFVSLANYIAIVFAAILGVALHGDRITWVSAVAFFVLIAALTLHQRAADTSAAAGRARQAQE